ncbi:MAG: RagB/SusD family nutrient uptake outer membrane protein [Bacteroidales bacterium]|nr:RagB/SusD family nutrient uptake outer membrane protein [Bacteroidales bacterium]
MKQRLVFPVIILTLSASLILTSCEKFLDKGPEENLSVEEVFQERNYVERWLYNLYSGLPMEMDFHNVYNTLNPYAGAADELEITPGYAASQSFNRGGVSPSYSHSSWADASTFSRKCNLFLENIHRTPMEESERREWTAEAHFMRAFYNFMALRVYGPIPIYDEILSPGSDFTAIERARFDDCVSFLLEDLNIAIKDLPARRSSAYTGRATSVSAAALKSRLLLYAASPLFNGNSDYSQMKDKNGESLIPVGYDASKWKLAAQAAKECIDLCNANGYELHYSDDRDPVTSYTEIFTKNWNEEVLFAMNVGTAQVWEMCMDPVSLLGAGIYCPTQQMVDSYRMDNGSDPFATDSDGDVIYSDDGKPAVIAESGYVESGFAAAPGAGWPAGVSNMYVNREPRFYASVNFCGQVWKGTSLELWYSGKDGMKIGGTYYTATGYIQKKMADPESNPSGSSPVLNRRCWIYFRLAEQFLNYAEALNESDPGNPDILKYLNEIRVRGGIPALQGSFSQEQMRKLIHQERHIEMAFETHRFFDVRRWKTAAKTDNATIYGIDVHSGSYLQDPAFYKRTVVEKRTFNSPAMYLLPISKGEIEKIPAMVQNYGY